MYKIIPVLLLSFGAITTGVAQETLIIKGNITGDTKGYNKIYIQGQGVKTDSVVIHNNTFELTLPYKLGIVPYLYTEYDLKVNHYRKPVEAFTDTPGELLLKDIDITKGPGSGTWVGTEATELFGAWSRKSSVMNHELNAWMNTRYSKEALRTKEVRQVYDSVYSVKLAALLRDFVQAHSNSFASTVIVRRAASGMAETDLGQIAALLSNEQKATETGKELSGYIHGRRSSANGAIVSDFILPAPDGQMLPFSSMHGKYVLIDFWASWCGPCKKSFPHMKEVYKKYKGDKFEIYSISIDTDKDAWLKELKNQALPWKQALDTKNIARSGFAVTAVPTTYLIGPDGKILMKEIGFDSSGNGELEKKLNGLFAL